MTHTSCLSLKCLDPIHRKNHFWNYYSITIYAIVPENRSVPNALFSAGYISAIKYVPLVESSFMMLPPGDKLFYNVTESGLIVCGERDRKLDDLKLGLIW